MTDLSQPHILPYYRAVGRPYWVVQYGNGTFYPEFFNSVNNIQENEFSRIDKDNIHKFTFVGPTLWGFEARGGEFFIGDHRFGFNVGTEFEAVKVTNPQFHYGPYLKQFKTGISEMTSTGKQTNVPCAAFSFGWRREFVLGGSNINLDVEIVCVTELMRGTPEPEKSYFRVTVSASQPVELLIDCFRHSPIDGENFQVHLSVPEANTPFTANLGGVKYGAQNNP